LDPLPLSIAIEASQTTAAPGDAINFLVNAQGGDLLGIDTDYGDGTAEQYATGGARTARVTFRHAYTTAGTYQVRATVTDARAGNKEATLAVTIR
jgi:PKD repeat protein